MPQLVCPNCQTLNRTPDGRDAAAAKCGRCGEPLFQGRPADVSGPELEAHRRSTQGLALLLDVWAPWCAPCREMAPQFAAVAPQLEPQVRLLKLNAEAEPTAAGALGVSSIPALLLIQDGKVAARTAGAMSAGQIVAWTHQVLGHRSEPSKGTMT